MKNPLLKLFLFALFTHSFLSCEKEVDPKLLPIVSTAKISSLSFYSAQSGGVITTDGGCDVVERGVCWSTTPAPTISDAKTTNGTGTGSFTSSLSGLQPFVTYNVRAYAINSVGTAYGNELSFSLMGTVTSPATGRIWLDRNLGASQVAASSADAEAYGDSYQWGRNPDGHEKRTSQTTSSLSNSDTPGHGMFVTINSDNYDWRSPQNNNLWQGVNGVNNPCPEGFRIPTAAEWEAERASWSSNNIVGAFASPLKLPAAGNRHYISGSLYNVGSGGYYW